MAACRETHVEAASGEETAPVSVSAAPPAPPAPPSLAGDPLRDEGDEEDDEGDAPEEVSHGVARDQALRSIKDAEDSRRREKADVKEKRRLKHELYTQQKKRKMLSEDILKAVGAGKSRKVGGRAKEKKSGRHGDVAGPDEESKEGGEEQSDPAGMTRKQSKEWVQGESRYRVLRLRDEGLGARRRQDAREFLQRRLYGQGCQRVSANDFFSLKNKTGAEKKPALQFIKDGGADLKNKKERRKRRREEAEKA